MKRTKPLKRLSTKRALQMKEYVKVKEAFITSHDICVKCECDTEFRDRTLHHFYGRTGALLCWVPGFRMACRSCHAWIESHRNQSVKLGFRAPDDLFGRPSKVIPK